MTFRASKCFELGLFVIAVQLARVLTDNERQADEPRHASVLVSQGQHGSVQDEVKTSEEQEEERGFHS